MAARTPVILYPIAALYRCVYNFFEFVFRDRRCQEDLNLVFVNRAGDSFIVVAKLILFFHWAGREKLTACPDYGKAKAHAF